MMKGTFFLVRFPKALRRLLGIRIALFVTVLHLPHDTVLLP